MNPVIEAARDRIKRASAHWTVQGDLLGQIEDEGIWREVKDPATDQPYASFRAWALNDLDMTVAALTDLMKNYRQARGFDIEFPGRWQHISAPSMRQLRRVLATAGPAEARTWLEKAIVIASATRLEKVIDAQLGKEQWVRWSASVPGDYVGTLEAMLAKVLPDVLKTPKPDVARIKDRDVRFRCLELVAAHVIAGYVPGANDDLDAALAREPGTVDWIGALEAKPGAEGFVTDAQFAAFFKIASNVADLREQLRRTLAL